jgi:hypothetical protein
MSSDIPASVLPTPATLMLTLVLRTGPGIALASYPSPACDESSRRDWAEELACPRR